MALRPIRVAGVAFGCAVLAVIAAAPASAQVTDRVGIEGSAPVWATPQARVGSVDDQERRSVQVALALRDPRGAQRLAEAVSDPDSPQYRKFLGNTEFTDRFAARPATVLSVTSWLRSQGLTVQGVSDNRAFVQVSGDVGRLRAAFGVTLAKFRTTLRDGRTVTLTAPEQSISLPRGLRGAVSAVLGLDDAAATITTGQVARRAPDGSFPRAARPAPRSGEGVTASAEYCALHWGEATNTAVPQKHGAGKQSNYLCGYTTAQTRAIYGLTGAETGAGRSVAIVGAYNLPSIVADTNRAAATYGSTALASGQYSAVLPSAYDNQDECEPEAWASEQALDVQAIHTVAPAAKIVYYGASSCFDLYNALNRAVVDNKAEVISNSWLYPGESLVPAAEREQMGRIAVQATIQGQSLVFCSGDSGDNSSPAGRAEATYPASHPWVTAVGGTTVALDGANKVVFSTGWENSGYTQSGNAWVAQTDRDGRFAGGAGGGFSGLYKAPAYQQGVVPASLAQGRRAMPDIAALADSYTGLGIGYTTGQGQYVEFAAGGTSLAAPLIAGLVADAAQVQGVARWGFLNDALYKLTGSAQVADVTPVAAGIWSPFMVGFGGVEVPGTPGSYLLDLDTRPQSLQSGPGWDAVTGIGTPTAGFVRALGK